MPILDLKAALELGKISEGTVLVNVPPSIRQGRRDDFMVGQFMNQQQNVEFKIWEERIFATIRDNGVGMYDVKVEGSEYNGSYLTVLEARPTQDTSLGESDFLPAVDRERLNSLWRDALDKLGRDGLSEKAVLLIRDLIGAEELGGRFTVEGAAIRHHDNLIGGLAWHTTKMLNILAAVMENNVELRGDIDMLTVGIVVHDIGKVYEYNNLGPGEYWYANHRVRGIEFLADHRDRIIADFGETFYRQIQSIISGHHGEYGDRPQTVAAAIVHYIDTLESQVTGLIQSQQQSNDERTRFSDWGFLMGLPNLPDPDDKG